TLLLDQQFQGPIAATACGHLEHAGFLPFAVEGWPYMQGLDQAAAGDGYGQFLDRDAGFDAPDIGLAQRQLVERDIPRGREGDLLNGSGHLSYSMTGAGSLSLRPPTRHEAKRRPLPLKRAAQNRKAGQPEFRLSGSAYLSVSGSAWRRPGRRSKECARPRG